MFYGEVVVGGRAFTFSVEAEGQIFKATKALCPAEVDNMKAQDRQRMATSLKGLVGRAIVKHICENDV